MVFVGREVASVPSGLLAGDCLARTPLENPVRAAYFHFFDGKQKSRHVADLATVLFAARGPRDYWDLETKGWMDLHPDCTFAWKFNTDKNQAYLLKKQVNGQPNDHYIESVLDDLLLHHPTPK